jgi:hypothetical protein
MNHKLVYARSNWEHGGVELFVKYSDGTEIILPMKTDNALRLASDILSLALTVQDRLLATPPSLPEDDVPL